MANYTITRQTRTIDNYGCTNFATNQQVGETAQLGNFAGSVNIGALDGDIVWFIDADPGFTVDVDDFEINNTTPTNITQTPGVQRTFQGSGLPSPILGVVMEKVSVTRIKVVVFLFPYDPLGITGMPFIMPSNSIDIAVVIVGCAEPQGGGTHLRMIHDTGTEESVDQPTYNVVVGQSQTNPLEVEKINYGNTSVSGITPRGEEELELFSYTINAAKGTRFISTPTLAISTNEYRQSSTVTRDDRGNVIGVEFNLFKNI